jgi:hypothetical protein
LLMVECLSHKCKALSSNPSMTHTHTHTHNNNNNKSKRHEISLCEIMVCIYCLHKSLFSSINQFAFSKFSTIIMNRII